MKQRGVILYEFSKLLSNNQDIRNFNIISLIARNQFENFVALNFKSNEQIKSLAPKLLDVVINEWESKKEQN